MLNIRVVSRAGEPLEAALQAEFGEAGGDIGRGTDCTLVLPDPERRISRKHVHVARHEGRYVMRLMSTNLPVELEGVPLAPGAEHVLLPGARFRIGPYVLQAMPASVRATDVMAVVPSNGPRASVFDDLLRPGEPSPSSQVDVVIGETSGWARKPGAPDPVQALYAGLGLAPAGADAASAEQMRRVGALLRAMVEGTIGLLAARSAAKHELGAGLTLPQATENNPLKFAPDAKAALKLLLEPAERGYLPPLQAVKEAFDDLKAHELSVLAGMRGAIEAMLQQFDPKVLESRLSAPGMWDNLLPVNRKARLWERYGEMHAELMRDIEDDVDAVFSRAFLEAYLLQRKRLSGR